MCEQQITGDGFLLITIMTSQHLVAVARALIVAWPGNRGERIQANGYARHCRLQHRDGSVV